MTSKRKKSRAEVEREPFYSKAQLRFDSTNIETATDTLETANLRAGILSTLNQG
ncbi:MAG: hypothetical protein KIG90_00780 [Muribaculaceae bacterium]|nr:hypothetical protein [Muribaculaceae bacterium]